MAISIYWDEIRIYSLGIYLKEYGRVDCKYVASISCSAEDRSLMNSYLIQKLLFEIECLYFLWDDCSNYPNLNFSSKSIILVYLLFPLSAIEMWILLLFWYILEMLKVPLVLLNIWQSTLVYSESSPSGFTIVVL